RVCSCGRRCELDPTESGSCSEKGLSGLGYDEHGRSEYLIAYEGGYFPFPRACEEEISAVGICPRRCLKSGNWIPSCFQRPHIGKREGPSPSVLVPETQRSAVRAAPPLERDVVFERFFDNDRDVDRAPRLEGSKPVNSKPKRPCHRPSGGVLGWLANAFAIYEGRRITTCDGSWCDADCWWYRVALRSGGLWA